MHQYTFHGIEHGCTCIQNLLIRIYVAMYECLWLHNCSLWTHLRLVLLSLQAPHTMPTMSSTPRAPVTTPPRYRPTTVALLESVLAGQLQSLLVSAPTRVILTACIYTGVSSQYAPLYHDMCNTLELPKMCEQCYTPRQFSTMLTLT